MWRHLQTPLPLSQKRQVPIADNLYVLLYIPWICSFLYDMKFFFNKHNPLVLYDLSLLSWWLSTLMTLCAFEPCTLWEKRHHACKLPFPLPPPPLTPHVTLTSFWLKWYFTLSVYVLWFVYKISSIKIYRKLVKQKF